MPANRCAPRSHRVADFREGRGIEFNALDTIAEGMEAMKKVGSSGYKPVTGGK